MPRLALAAWLFTALGAWPVHAATPARRAAPSPAPANTVPVNTPGALTVLYGDDHVFAIVVPNGWVVDDTSGLGSRIRTVIYPKGQTWIAAKTVMYVNPLHQDLKARKTLRQMIDRDVAAFRKATPGGRVTTAPSLKTSQGKTAEVRYFAPGPGEPGEAVAYLEEPGLVMLLVLSSTEPGGFRRALPAFRQLVQGYQFVGANIQTPTGR